MRLAGGNKKGLYTKLAKMCGQHAILKDMRLAYLLKIIQNSLVLQQSSECSHPWRFAVSPKNSSIRAVDIAYERHFKTAKHNRCSLLSGLHLWVQRQIVKFFLQMLLLHCLEFTSVTQGRHRKN